MKPMTWTTRITLFIIFGSIALSFYTHRALFFSRFDEPYWKDKYEHSQWLLPLSVRTIGDDGLYLYEGYRLIHGADPTRLNAEVPPLGKYLIGLSILLFGNGHWFGFLTTTGVIVMTMALAHAMTGNARVSIGAGLLIALDPLIGSQMPLTMLDSLHALLLLAFLFSLIQSTTAPFKKQVRWVLLSAIFLGLFSNTKAPILTPTLGLLGVLTIWRKTHQMRDLLVFLGVSVLSYLALYGRYFLLGHTLIDFLKVQKWIFAFYKASDLAANRGSMWTTLLFGHFQNLFTRAWEPVGEWNPAWPLITILGIIGYCLMILKRDTHSRGTIVAVVLFLLTLVFSFIPFWSRYLTLVLPLLYIGTVITLHRNISIRIYTILLIVLALSAISSTYRIYFPTPEATVKQLIYDWRYGFFQDMYEELTTNAQYTDRKTFHTTGLGFYYNAEIEEVYIDLLTKHWSRIASPQTVSVRVTYVTRHLGRFTEEKSFPVVKESGRWKILWEWGHLFEGLTENSSVKTTIDYATRGAIRGGDTEPYAYDAPGYMVWITPQELDTTKEESLYTLLANAFGNRVQAINLHQRVVGNTIPNRPIPVGVLPQKAVQDIDTVLSFRGITLTSHLARLSYPEKVSNIGKIRNTSYVECCSYLYTTTAYDGETELEKENNTILKGINGGTIVIKDKNEKVIRTILEVAKKEGKDVKI